MTANLPDIIAGSPLESGHITAIPLYVRHRGPAIDYRLGVDAMGDGSVTLGERGHGTVASIRARNASDRRVLFVDGDHLLGARQNRAVISSTVIGPRQDVDLPVCCVEQGRWHANGDRFRAAPASSPASVRSVMKSCLTSALYGGRGRVTDQSRVWATIAGNIKGPAPTRALYDSMLFDVSRIQQVSRGLGYVERASGIALGVGGRLASIDLFDKPTTCAVYWKRIVDGAAHDPRFPGRISAGAVYDVLDELVTTSWQSFPSVGSGREQRARLGSATASIVELDGRCVHLGVAALS